MTGPLVLAAGFLTLFLSSGVRSCLPEMVQGKGRDTSERRKAALLDLRILWIARFTGLLLCGAGAVLVGGGLAPLLSVPAWAAVVILALLVLLLGEIMPSLLVGAAPDTWMRILRYPYSVIRLVFALPALLVRTTQGEKQLEDSGWLVTPPDVIWLERRREKGDPGEFEKEQQLMDSIIDFSDTIVREVMVPRIDMVCVELQDDLEQVVRQVRRAGHSRIPVYREKIDDIVGVLYAKDLLAFISGGSGRFVLEDLLREAYFVPEYKRIDELLREFQKHRIHMAVVVDEYGGTAGLVTIEDILEEVFGEILDEYDKESLLVQSIGRGAYRLDARLPLDDLNDLLGTSFSGEDVETLAGMLYQALGKIPRPGESVVLEGLEFTVEKVRAQRILLVRAARVEESADPDG